MTYVRAILLRDEGACISPFNAWILLQGTETLSLRVDRHVENTKKVVEFLANDPHVASQENHPSSPDHPDHELYERYFPNGGASIFTFEIKGGQEAAWKFIDNLQIFSLLANVADVKSLAIHPATTTHSQLTEAELADQGITPSTIRLSIGTENADDIIWDLQQAFAKPPTSQAKGKSQMASCKCQLRIVQWLNRKPWNHFPGLSLHLRP